jgi:hypothetical protein
MGNAKNKLKNKLYAVEIKATTTCSGAIVGRKRAFSFLVGTLCSLAFKLSKLAAKVCKVINS